MFTHSARKENTPSTSTLSEAQVAVLRNIAGYQDYHITNDAGELTLQLEFDRQRAAESFCTDHESYSSLIIANFPKNPNTVFISKGTDLTADGNKHSDQLLSAENFIDTFITLLEKEQKTCCCKIM